MTSTSKPRSTHSGKRDFLSVDAVAFLRSRDSYLLPWAPVKHGGTLRLLRPVFLCPPPDAWTLIRKPNVLWLGRR